MVDYPDLIYNFPNKEHARQAMKAIFGSYPTAGYTDSDPFGNPSPSLPIIEKGQHIATVTLANSDSVGKITVSFESDVPIEQTKLAERVIDQHVKNNMGIKVPGAQTHARG